MIYKVIIVEDEDPIRKWLKYSFDWQSNECCVVADTYDSKEAIKLIDEFHPEIVITDINMPIINGLEMIAIAQQTHDFESIIISGYENFKYAQEAIQLGVVRYLTKPIIKEELIQALNYAKDRVKSFHKMFAIESTVYDDLSAYNSLLNKYQKDSDKDKLVKEILLYIQKNYKNKLMLKEVAELFNYSESTINGRMKCAINSTFIQYLNQYRIFKAIEIIKNKNISLNELSFEVGISDYQHFHFLFKKYTGYSPKEFLLLYKPNI